MMMTCFDLELFVALEISTELPSEEELERWCGEPVKAAILSTSLFLTNKKGVVHRRE